MQIIESSKKYDIVIVSSEAGGGMATKVLANAGLKVAVVDVGPYFDPANTEQQTQLKWPTNRHVEAQTPNVCLESLIWLMADGS